VTQLLDRAQGLVNHCPTIQRMWYYAIVDIDLATGRTLEQMRWSPLFSKGEVYYREHMTTRKQDGRQVPTPTFAVSFDALISDAKARNHTFLKILREGIKRYAKAPVSP